MEVQATPACPFAAGADERKSAVLPIGDGPAGQWRRDYDGVRGVLRDRAARQAGFGAERTLQTRGVSRPPILFLDGEPHRHQRAATARFFTPNVVATRYRAIMETTTDRLVARLTRRGHADLDALSLEMAVTVAADVVGLTNSNMHGMARRLSAFFDLDAGAAATRLRKRWSFIRSQVAVLRFHLFDVRPAIAARRRQPREDVISHLLSEGYSSLEILTECVTYGAAGMITTREFITMAGWHLLERPALKARFLSADEAGKHLILEEILRMEPVVAALFRSTEDGTIGLDVRAANADEAAVGACPMALDPDRARLPRVGGAGLSFGDGEHRCPGANLALHETAVFLDRLLRLPSLRLERAPTLGWNAQIMGYELRGCRIAVA